MPFATCPITQGALLRFHMRWSEQPSFPEAKLLLQAVCNHHLHQFWRDDLECSDIPEKGVRGHKQVTDAYLAGLAAAHSGVLATMDEALPALHTSAILSSNFGESPPFDGNEIDHFAIPLSLMITGAGCFLILATGSLPYGYDGHKELTLMWLASIAAIVSLLLLAILHSQPRSMPKIISRFAIYALGCVFATFLFYLAVSRGAILHF